MRKVVEAGCSDTEAHATQWLGILASMPAPLSAIPATRYQRLLGQKARTRRAAALACAGRALDALSALGVKARLIGSLAAEPSRFRSDSDIDILVEDRNGIEPTTLFLETEKQIDGLPFDLLFLETVPPDMRQFL